MDANLREDISKLHAQVCKGLADPNRILILYTLAKVPHTVSVLAERVELPQPTVSRHLKILRERGLVIARRTGQSGPHHTGRQSRFRPVLRSRVQLAFDRLCTDPGTAAVLPVRAQKQSG